RTDRFRVVDHLDRAGTDIVRPDAMIRGGAEIGDAIGEPCAFASQELRRIPPTVRTIGLDLDPRDRTVGLPPGGFEDACAEIAPVVGSETIETTLDVALREVHPARPGVDDRRFVRKLAERWARDPLAC